MIIKEFYKTRTDGVNLYRTYSDKGLKIRKVGTDEIYDDAIDIENIPYTYEETDILIDYESDEATETDYQSALRDMGQTYDQDRT